MIRIQAVIKGPGSIRCISVLHLATPTRPFPYGTSRGPSPKHVLRCFSSRAHIPCVYIVCSMRELVQEAPWVNEVFKRTATEALEQYGARMDAYVGDTDTATTAGMSADAPSTCALDASEALDGT